MKRLLVIVRWLAFALAVLVSAVAAWLYAAETSGWLARRLERELSARLNEDIAIERVELAWFEPGIDFFGVHPREAAQLVTLEHAHAHLRWNGFALPVVERVDIQGGRIVLGNELFQRIQSRAGSVTPAEVTRTRAPIMVVEGVQVDLDHPLWGEIPLGRIDALGQRDERGQLELEGRIQPSFAGADAPQILVSASRNEAGQSSVHAWATSIPLSEAAFPEHSPLAPVRAWKPRGALSFDVRASYDESGEHAPTGHLRMQLERGSLQPLTKSAPMDSIEVDVDAHCTPDTLADLADPRSWQNTLRASASWNGHPLEAWALAGRNAGAGLAARAWLAIPCLPLSRELLDAVGLGEDQFAATQWHALDPKGFAHVAIGLAWPSEATLHLERAARPVTTLELELDGETSIQVFGWPVHGHTEGFPLPVEQLAGRVVVLHDVRAEHDTLIGLAHVLGAHSRGSREEQPAFVEGMLRWTMLGSTDPALDLRFGAHAVPLDDTAREALAGLHGTDFIVQQFDPRGGHASVAARIAKLENDHVPSVALDLDFHGTSAAWHEMPARAQDLEGRVELVLDPRSALGVGFELRGATAHGASVHIAGRIQDDPDPRLAERVWEARHIQAFDVEVENIGLRGDDRAAMLSRQPDVRDALERLGPEGEAERGPQGRIDAHYAGATLATGAPFAWRVEIAPRGEMQFTPQAFPVQWQAVRGRVIVLGELPLVHDASPTTGLARVVLFIGDWTKQTRVACTAELPFEGDRSIELFGSGIDVKNASLVGAFHKLFERYDSVSLDALRVVGRVDLTGELHIPFAAPQVPEGIYRVRLRDNDVRLASGGHDASAGAARGLDGLNGILVQEGTELHGEYIRASLAGSPLELERARFFERDGGFWFQTGLRARALPLDAQHTSLFLDPATVTALLGGLGLRGEVDVDDARLELGFATPAHGDIVRFAGRAKARNAFVDIGLPLSIDSAEVGIEELVYEGNDVRVDATVRELDGRVADRELKRGALRFTYVEPHLSILELDATLEHGRLSGVAGEGAHSGSAFSMDLEPPFAFDLAMRVNDADVAGLLRGLFESDFASSGRLSGELRLTGDLSRMTGIAGEGSIDMRDTVLWSIPVVREMFAQLGFDSVATFDTAHSRFRIADGQIQMSDLRVSSQLLKLVGSGTLDFDGSLHHDLEVQYGLVDRLGPFRQLLYWVQNNLLSIAVRGDMSRPRVEIKGLLGLVQSPSKEQRALPLPGFAPLSERF